MENAQFRQVLTEERRPNGQESISPSGVCDQPFAHMSSPISAPPATMAGRPGFPEVSGLVSTSHSRKGQTSRRFCYALWTLIKRPNHSRQFKQSLSFHES